MRGLSFVVFPRLGFPFKERYVGSQGFEGTSVPQAVLQNRLLGVCVSCLFAGGFGAAGYEDCRQSAGVGVKHLTACKACNPQRGRCLLRLPVPLGRISTRLFYILG